MAGFGIRMTHKDQGWDGELMRLERRLADPQRALNEIGLQGLRSVAQNFRAQGRPTRWAPLRPVTRRRKGARKNKILVDSGRLRRSFTHEVSGSQVTVGTRTKYAAVHQFGARKGSLGRKMVTISQHTRYLKSGKAVTVRSHKRNIISPWGDIPARPMVAPQPHDIRIFRKILEHYSATGEVQS